MRIIELKRLREIVIVFGGERQGEWENALYCIVTNYFDSLQTDSIYSQAWNGWYLSS